MADALVHRGPDGCGIAHFSQATLIHNRLAIIDLQTGQQPLYGASQASCLVFNGEIYNYRELRESLSGYPFRTRSDSEVIVALYETEGVAGWRRLRGMYAFAVWDERSQQGFLVRDPVGIKPLFLAEKDGRLVFASEAKGILAYGLGAELELDALHQLLNFRYVTGDASLFRGIRQLPPGMMLTWRHGEYRMAPCLPEDEDGDATLEDLLAQSVRRHLASDVPVGCFLSGGIDSALIARLASRDTALSSYTLEVGDDPMEADNAGATAAWLNIPNQRQPFRLDDPLATHQAMVRHLETPKVNALQGMILAEFTASHVKVTLSGLGGDELFYGYNAHRIMWLAQQAATFLPVPVTRNLANLLMPLAGGGVWNERQRALQMLAQLPKMSSVYGILRNVWDAPEHRSLIYGERMLDASLTDSFAWLGERFPREGDAPRSMAGFELSNKLVSDLLWNEDRMSMRVGLESRVPFLDWSLVQYFRRHSRRELMPLGSKKHALKSCARDMLPAEFLRRRKSGFQLDIVAAAQQQLRPVFDEYLSPEKTRRYRLFNQNFIDTVRMAQPSRKLRWHYFMLYLMAQTHIWMEQFDVQ